jgi:hypothetical protein
VKEVGDLAEITTRNNKTVRHFSNIITATSSQMPGLQTQKRDLVVVDSTEFSVRLTLWGKQAEQFSTPIDSVIACKGVRVGDFNGKWLLEIANFPNSALHQGCLCPFSVPDQWLLALTFQKRTL